VRVLLLLLAAAGTLRANEEATQPAPDASSESGDAARLKAEGDAAMVELRYEEALDLYTQSYELEPNPALLYNRGRALEALARVPEALDQIERFAKVAPEELRSKVPQLDELIDHLRSNVCTLALEVNVDGARVLLRNEQIAESPIQRAIAVNAGRGVLEVVADGYRPFERQLTLPGGGELSVEVLLEPLATTGVLIVSASAAGAVVYIDGDRAGTAPVQRDLEAGRHGVRVLREGFEKAETTAVVSAGKTTKLDIKLNELPGVTEKWWFWTGVGVVVLGGAVLSYALVTERSPGRGDIPPHRVSAPLVSF
jgi:hypothetical protein